MTREEAKMLIKKVFEEHCVGSVFIQTPSIDGMLNDIVEALDSAFDKYDFWSEATNPWEE